MYTCCPNCRTVFRLSARHLQQAAGVVCCGRCEYSFSALSNIQESASDAIAQVQPLTSPEPEPQLTDNPELQDVITDPAHRKLWENAESKGLSSEDTWSSENGDDSAANGEQQTDPDETGNFQPDDFGADSESAATKLTLVDAADIDEAEEPVELEAAAVDANTADESGEESPQDTLVEDVEAFEAAVLATIHATEAKEWESSGPHFVGDDDEQLAAADEDKDGSEDEGGVESGASDTETLDEESGDDWDIDESLEGVEQPEDITVTERVIEMPEEEVTDEDIELELESVTASQPKSDRVESDDPSGDLSDSQSLEMTMEQQLEASYLADTGAAPAIDEDTDSREGPAEDSSEGDEDEAASEAALAEDASDDESSLAFLDQLAEGADENTSSEDVLGLALEGEDSDVEDDDSDAVDAEQSDDNDTARDIWLGEVTLESAKEDVPDEDRSDDKAAPDEENVPEEDVLEEDADEEEIDEEDIDEEDSDEEDSHASDDNDGDDSSIEEIELATENEDALDDDDNAEGDDSDDEDNADDADDEDEDVDDEPEFGTEEIILEGDTDIYEGESRADPYVAPSDSTDADSSLLAAHNAVRRYLPTAGIVALALLLLVQIVHGFRYQITAGDGGTWLESIYESLGMPLAQQWDLDAYDIRRVVGVGDETGSGVVEISAILTNRADKTQPYPTLRLVFTDRWDEVLAVRDLIPSEYSDSPPARGAKMVSGEQLAVDIRVQELDNALAANYRLEICLRQRDQTLICR